MATLTQFDHYLTHDGPAALVLKQHLMPVEGTDGVLVFPRVLQSQLKPKVGQMVLGRLGQGTAKPGQSAPWMLTEPTDADRTVGLAHLNKAKANADAPF